jgi:dipeptidyl aminopeptidase/acylaminoacyl peptidase
VAVGPLAKSIVRVLRVLGVAAAISVLGAGAAEAHAVGRIGTCPSLLHGRSDLGRIALVDGRGQLRVVDVATCRVHTLVSTGVEPPVRWSADGRYLAYGDGAVVPATGGTPAHPLGRLQPGWGTGSPGWVWSPNGHRLAGVTAAGAVLVGGPGISRQRLFPDGWGATSVAWSPTGSSVAVSRSLYTKSPPPYHQEIWLLDLRSGARTMLLRERKPDLAPPWLSGFSPDGRWLLAWEDEQNSASLAADGVPLVAVPVAGGRPATITRGELMYGDFVSWCTANSLALVQDNGGREVSRGDRIALAGPPPSWARVAPADPGRKSHLSFVSPACGPDDGTMIAAAAGPASEDLPFGHEHRSIWLLQVIGGNWHPLEPAPPPGMSDELPLWSSDGRWIAFVRTTPSGAGGSGRLYLLDLGARLDGHARLVGPIAPVGVTGNYYGHYGWAGQVAWYSR